MAYIDPDTGDEVSLGKRATAFMRHLQSAGPQRKRFAIEHADYLERLGFVEIMPLSGNPHNRLYSCTKKGQDYLAAEGS